MDREDSANLSQLVTIVSIAFVIAVLYIAEVVLQPLAMATLLTFLLAPLVSRLERLKIGRVPAVLATIGAVGLVVLWIGWVGAGQLIDLTAKLPEYKDNLSARIQSVSKTDNMMLSKVSAILTELVDEATESFDLSTDNPRRPVRVTIVESAPLPVRFLRDWLGPVLAPFGTLAIILLFLIFMLIYREDLRDRFINLAGIGHLSATTQALDEAGRRVSSYLIRLAIVNSTYGISVGIGLWFIEIPSPFLWGFLAAVLRFIPYVGPWIGALLPIALSLAVFQGWSRPMATVGLFIVLELISNNVVEPWLYGQGTGVSVTGIIAAALFWTWLWGPLGLVLAMPMTVCLTVLGRYAPGLNFVTVLLSDQPALEPKLRFYQRLLANDFHEASDIVDGFLATGSARELYSSLLLPSLTLAERDRRKGQLAETQRQFIHEFIGDTLREQAHADQGPSTVEMAASETDALVVAKKSSGLAVDVLCLPAESVVDELAGEMVAQSLTRNGRPARSLTTDEVQTGLEETLGAESIGAVVISAVAPGGTMRARNLCRRLRLQSSQLRIVVGLWNAGGDLSKTRERLAAAGATDVAAQLDEVVELLQDDSDTKR